MKVIQWDAHYNHLLNCKKWGEVLNFALPIDLGTPCQTSYTDVPNIVQITALYIRLFWPMTSSNLHPWSLCHSIMWGLVIWQIGKGHLVNGQLLWTSPVGWPVGPSKSNYHFLTEIYWSEPTCHAIQTKWKHTKWRLGNQTVIWFKIQNSFM